MEKRWIYAGIWPQAPGPPCHHALDCKFSAPSVLSIDKTLISRPVREGLREALTKTNHT